MANTDRLAQALRDVKRILNSPECVGIFSFAAAHNVIYKGENAGVVIDAALASLAPAAVEGDAALFVNNCENALDQSTNMWRRVISGEGHDMVAFQTPVAHTMQQCLRNARGVVAALTAQCEGLTKQITVTPKTLDALKALVKEISQDARVKRAQGMRDTPDLLENYAIRIDEVLKKYGAEYGPDRRTMVYALRPAVALIAAERERQIAREGWSPKHDRDEHGIGELAVAAACYASSDDARVAILAHWPWGLDWWKPTPNDRVRELVKAGALIVAEIERLSESVCKQCRGTGEVYDTQGAPWHCPSCHGIAAIAAGNEEGV